MGEEKSFLTFLPIWVRIAMPFVAGCFVTIFTAGIMYGKLADEIESAANNSAQALAAINMLQVKTDVDAQNFQRWLEWHDKRLNSLERLNGESSLLPTTRSDKGY